MCKCISLPLWNNELFSMTISKSVEIILYPSRVGIAKAPFINVFVSKIFNFTKVPVKSFESHSYFTAVIADELWQV